MGFTKRVRRASPLSESRQTVSHFAWSQPYGLTDWQGVIAWRFSSSELIADVDQPSNNLEVSWHGTCVYHDVPAWKSCISAIT